ncbi:glutathione S-transferase omega-1-like [Babylonia areolata]|uniref:glutathione S-transferase omega-1-like n=1 Tax=Babylonia areolata TaxID=304850 RepID=UPI003FD20D1C
MSVTEKVYKKGSEFPPLTKGKLRLYSMRFCPYAQRTRLVLAHKNIPHETVNVHLREKPDWFLERNPLGMVPVLEQDDKVLYESLITCDYLDDVYPDNRLTPADPFRKARDSMLVDYFGKKLAANFYKFMRSDGKDEEAKDTLIKAMNNLEEQIAVRGKFFGGDKVAMVDLMMWPWFERIAAIQKYCSSLVPSETNFPKMFSWMQTMLQQPSVKATSFSDDTHNEFIISFIVDNKPKYDLGLEP